VPPHGVLQLIRILRHSALSCGQMMVFRGKLYTSIYIEEGRIAVQFCYWAPGEIIYNNGFLVYAAEKQVKIRQHGTIPTNTAYGYTPLHVLDNECCCKASRSPPPSLRGRTATMYGTCHPVWDGYNNTAWDVVDFSSNPDWSFLYHHANNPRPPLILTLTLLIGLVFQAGQSKATGHMLSHPANTRSIFIDS
jgi:hypothetical protein